MSVLWHWVPVKNSPAGHDLQQKPLNQYSPGVQLKGFWLCLECDSSIARITCGWKKTRGSLYLLVTAEDGLEDGRKRSTKAGPPCADHSRDYLMLCCAGL